MLEDDWGERGGRLVSVNVVGEEWSVVVADVCRQADLQVVMPGGGDSASERIAEAAGDDAKRKVSYPVQLSLWRSPVRRVLEELALMKNLRPVLDGDVVRFRSAEVGAVSVVVPGYLAREQAVEVMTAVAGKDAVVRSAGPNVLVAGGPEVVERASRIGDVFGAAEPGQWVIGVWFVEMNADTRNRLGVELGVSGTINGLVGGNAASLIAEAILDGTIEASQSSRWARLLSHATLTLIEGESASAQRVVSVPVPQRTVSPQGTVQISGYSFVDAGLQLTALGRAVPSGLHLTLKPELSSVAGFVEDAPIVNKSRLEVTAIVRDGDWLVLAGLDDFAEREEKRGLGGLLTVHDASMSRVLIVLRVAQRVARAEATGTVVAER